jgi:hypothetical protein
MTYWLTIIDPPEADHLRSLRLESPQVSAGTPQGRDRRAVQIF